MTYGDGPEAVLRVLAQYGDDDVAIYHQAELHINHIRSQAADLVELWEAIKGYAIAARYERGDKIEAIAAAHGVSKTTIHNTAMRYGATPRNKTSGEREVIPFEKTPGINVLAKIRAERDRAVAELIRMHRDDEAERLLSVDKTLERWRWRRRKKTLGKAVSGGALVAGGAAIGSMSCLP